MVIRCVWIVSSCNNVTASSHRCEFQLLTLLLALSLCFLQASDFYYLTTCCPPPSSRLQVTDSSEVYWQHWAHSYLAERKSEAGRNSVTPHCPHSPTTAPSAHIQTRLIFNEYKSCLFAFSQMRWSSGWSQSAHHMFWSTSVSSTLPPVFVLAGPWCTLCHLPLSRWQQLLCPHHPGLCDDVSARDRGGGSLLRAAPKVSTPAFHSANQARLVQREAAGLGGQHPRLGLITTEKVVLRVTVIGKIDLCKTNLRVTDVLQK